MSHQYFFSLIRAKAQITPKANITPYLRQLPLKDNQLFWLWWKRLPYLLFNRLNYTGLQGLMQQKKTYATGTLIVFMIRNDFFSEVLCLMVFVSKFRWPGSNSLSATSIWSILCLYYRKSKNRLFFKTLFFQMALISKRFELQMPDWSQRKDNLM